MAKRKTIRVNPLDTLVPDLTTRRTDALPMAAKTRSAGPASVIAPVPTPRKKLGDKDSNPSSPAAQIVQPPAAADIFSRIQSLEKENEYIKWLLGGAILFALFL